MKKAFAILLVLCSLLALASCGAKASTPDTSSANKIVYGARYILTDHITKPEEQQIYYVIYKDHLEYHFYEYFPKEEETQHYTVSYQYTIIDEGTLAFFYDSYVIYEDDNATKKIYSDHKGRLIFSENVLSSPSGTLYVREDYAEKQLPNFGK